MNYDLLNRTLLSVNILVYSVVILIDLSSERYLVYSLNGTSVIYLAACK